MERQMARLAHEQQALRGAVVRRRVATAWAALAGLIGVHLYGHTPGQQRLIGKKAVQFREGPFGGMSIGLALLLARLFAMLPFGALADVGQILQADAAVRVGVHDLPADGVVA